MAQETTEEHANAVLAVVRDLVAELHPRRALRLHVTLDSRLDRELAFDSLSRVELILRLQREFHVALPEDLFANAETPRDLVSAMLTAQSGRRDARAAMVATAPLEELESTPDHVRTLPEMLDWHVERTPDRPHVYLYGDAQEPEVIRYASLAAGARELAAGLQARGLAHGQAVAIMLPTSRDYLHTFFGVLMAGGVPVPIYPPARPSQIEDHLRRHAGILANAAAVTLVTAANARGVARLLRAHVPTLRAVVTPEELVSSGAELEVPRTSAEDIAFLQYTSGSTGQPKGVMLTHANLLANVRAMCAAAEADSTDVFVSWLPLYHDMGLIGAWLASLYLGIQFVLMSPIKFLTYPPRWLWAIHQHRGTLTAAPNFAYELCLSKVEDADIEGLDLSSLRMAFNGAEPVSPNTLRRFTERFAPYGFSEKAFAPVFGLAEAAVGLAFPPLDRVPVIDRIDRRRFEARGEVVHVDDPSVPGLEFVACGQPLPGYEIRVVDEAGHELPDGTEGRLEFQGPSATQGYMDNPEATAQLFDGPWLDTGDLAYIRGGDAFITRRVKDVIIRGGRNVYPYEVEEAVGELEGVRKGCVAVFGSLDRDTATERVIVVAETRESDPAARDALTQQVLAVASDIIDLPPDEVVLVPPHSVLKTSSGKIRRTAVRERFEAGRLGEEAKAVWWQIARLAAASSIPRLKSLWRIAEARAYGAWVYLLLGLIGLPVWVLVALLPTLSTRWGVARAGSRLFLALAGIALDIRGLERLPARSVVVANHASYVDGMVLVATLPEGSAFVAKGELADSFIAGRFLRGIGAEFVERLDTEGSVAAVEHMRALAEGGTSLVFFPEGTFTRVPGLRPFHMGAFMVAAQAGLPVAPVTITGTRAVLRDDVWLPRRGAISVTVGESIVPAGTDWQAAVTLREAARGAILALLDEPDLVDAEDPLANLRAGDT